VRGVRGVRRSEDAGAVQATPERPGRHRASPRTKPSAEQARHASPAASAGTPERAAPAEPETRKAPPKVTKAPPAAGVAPHGPAAELAGGEDPPAAPAGGAALFTRYALDYAAQRSGQPLAVLQAGSTTAANELDLAALRADGCQISVSRVDDDNAVCRAALERRPELTGCVLSDLRSVPLAPRSQDIVQCSMLLARITNADLILGRFVETLKPGGLLLLRLPDMQSAAGFLDRILPGSMRRLIWNAQRPGEPGPYAAVYEPLATASGIQSFAARHGLVIAGRQVAGDPAGPRWLLAACKAVSSVSAGRLAWTHDELHYVIRKPESRFARVL
jgi:SAM-dependent methyltransferase